MGHRGMAAPRISVIIVSDYAAKGVKDWSDELACAQAFAAQDIAEPVDILVVGGAAAAAEPPPLLPADGRLLLLPHHRSTALRDAAVEATAGALVAVVEADCLPAPDWLRRLVAVLDRTPDCQAVSGRTIYREDSAFMRIATLLDRGFVERGSAGRTSHVSTNGALYRRDFLQRFPFPEEANPFVAGWQRNDAILRAGSHIEVEPAAVMRHAYSGFGFERDLRRNVGFRDARVWGRGGGLGNVLRVWRHRNRLEREDLKRLGTQRLRRFDWPLVPPIMLLRRLLELPGIRAGLRDGAKLQRTGYR